LCTDLELSKKSQGRERILRGQRVDGVINIERKKKGGLKSYALLLLRLKWKESVQGKETRGGRTFGGKELGSSSHRKMTRKGGGSPPEELKIVLIGFLHPIYEIYAELN